MKENVNYGPDETVLKAQGGDEEAMEQLLRDYRPMLVRAVVASARGLSEAGYTEEDLMQEAAVALTAAVATYKGDRGVTFGAYARRCVRNRLISVARSALRVRRAPVELPEKRTDIPLPAASFERLEGALTDYERDVFRLLCMGYKPAEMSRHLGREIKSVYNAICRIKAKAKLYKE